MPLGMDTAAHLVQRALEAERYADDPLTPVVPLPSPQQVEPGMPRRIAYTRTRTVDIAPHVLERHRVSAVDEDVKSDAFRMLRTQLLMQMRENGWQTLAVTSPNKGAGKSTISLNLAISFAMEVDYTALLVDADLRDPDR